MDRSCENQVLSKCNVGAGALEVTRQTIISLESGRYNASLRLRRLAAVALLALGLACCFLPLPGNTHKKAAGIQPAAFFFSVTQRRAARGG